MYVPLFVFFCFVFCIFRDDLVSQREKHLLSIYCVLSTTLDGYKSTRQHPQFEGVWSLIRNHKEQRIHRRSSAGQGQMSLWWEPGTGEKIARSSNEGRLQKRERSTCPNVTLCLNSSSYLHSLPLLCIQKRLHGMFVGLEPGLSGGGGLRLIVPLPFFH
jgi:hypothetical protein